MNGKTAADFSAADRFAFAPFYRAQPVLGAVPFLFNIPHAGRYYPQDFMAQTCLDKRSIRASEDCYVDMLFRSVPQFGAGFMAVNFPRAFLDVNRSAFALDMKMFQDMDKNLSAALYESQLSSHIRAGFGVIPRNVALNTAIYAEKIAFAEAAERLIGFYFPYHAALLQELLHLRTKFGEAILLDCHSMPGIAAYYEGRTEPDIILGNRFGQTCCPQLLDMAQLLLKNMGYCVTCNYPYAGGYITTHYGRPELGIQALQIEINRNIYLDLHNLQLTDNFPALQADMVCFSGRLIQLWQEEYPVYAAAE